VEEEDENEQEKVPSLAETYEALQNVKKFFYAQYGSDADRRHIFGLGKAYLNRDTILPRSKDNVGILC
jgi:hypothetical protein